MTVPSAHSTANGARVGPRTPRRSPRRYLLASSVTWAETDATSRPGTPRRSLVRSVPGGLLVLALGYGCFAQGGFYGSQFRLLLVLIALSLATAMALSPPKLRDLLCPPIVAPLLLCAWSAISAAHAHHPKGALPTIGLMGALAAAVLIVRRSDPLTRQQLGVGILLAGVGVAATGWFGVVARSGPSGVDDLGLWRAASTITYTNGTAALLAPLALVSLARVVEEPAARLMSLVTYALLLGLGATLSRAGLLGFVFGVFVLIARCGPRRLLAATWPPVVGSLVAFAGMVPSFPARLSPRPWIAVAAAIVGAAVSLAPAWPALRRRVVVRLLVVLAVALSALGLAIQERSDLTPRLSATSEDRSDEWRATFDLVRQHPVWGTGPGHFRLEYVDHDGREAIAEFTHNELLQAWAELGSVGLIIIVGGLAMTARAVVWQPRAKIERWLWAGAPAALLALVINSSLDYVWHIPVIPVAGAIITGLAVSSWDAG